MDILRETICRIYENWEAWFTFFLIVSLTTASRIIWPDIFGLDLILEADTVCGAGLYLVTLMEKGTLN